MRHVLVILLAIFLSIPCSADLVIKMTVDDTNLGLGDSTLVHLFAEIDDGSASGGNGLVLWDIGIDADVSGVLDISNHSFVSPSDIWESGFSSTVGTGGGSAWVMKDDDQTSTTGDGLTEIFNFEVTALAVGVVTYDITGFGDLVDFTAYDIVFDSAGSANVITVHIPEPTSLVLFALMGGLVRRHRK